MNWTRLAALVILLSPAAHPQDAELDRTDAQAVARAYVDACREGDLETAVSFMFDEREIEAAREFSEEFMDEPAEMGMDMEDIFVEFQFLPVPFDITREDAGAVVDDEEARVTFKADFTFDQELVLKRQEDGTWAVALLDSVKATRQAEITFLEMELGMGDERAMEMAGAQMMAGMETAGLIPPPPKSSAEALQVLWQLAFEYANEHDGRLPEAGRWTDELELFVLDRALLKNPEQPDLACGYAMNIEADGVDVQGIWQDDALGATFLFVEWPTGERNAVTDPGGFADTESHRENGEVAYVTLDRSMHRVPGGEPLELEQPEIEAGPEAVPLEEEDQTEQQHAQACQSNMRQIIEAIRKFARKNEGTLPEAATWMDDLAPYLMDANDGDGIWACPSAPDLEFAYAFNADVSGKNALDLPGHHELVVIFESDIDDLNAASTWDPEVDQLTRHSAAFSLPEGHPGGYVGYLNGAVAVPTDAVEE